MTTAGGVPTKLTPALRLILGSAVLTVVAAVLWWILGYTLGKSALDQGNGGAAFARLFSYREASFLPLFALALLSYLTRLVAAEAGASRWTRLALLAAAAGLVFAGDKSGSELGWVLFVFAAAATAEASGVQGLLAALVAGAFVAVAFVFDKADLATGQKIVVVVMRDVFLFAPLLAGPEWLDRWLWRTAK
jgi:hypothetical protein